MLVVTSRGPTRRVRRLLVSGAEVKSLLQVRRSGGGSAGASLYLEMFPQLDLEVMVGFEFQRADYDSLQRRHIGAS